MLTGSGGNGKACGGRFLVNAKGGGLFKHDGPQITVATASSENAPTKVIVLQTSEESSKQKIILLVLTYIMVMLLQSVMVRLELKELIL